MLPSTRPVTVMRCQNFSRGPRNVSPNSPNATARPMDVTRRPLVIADARCVSPSREVSPRTECGDLYCIRRGSLLHLRLRASGAEERSFDDRSAHRINAGGKLGLAL